MLDKIFKICYIIAVPHGEWPLSVGFFIINRHWDSESLRRVNEIMYAIIKTGGKQVKVEENRYYDVELLNAEVGSKVQFDALLISDGAKSTVGTPVVKGAVVEGEVIMHGKGNKITVFTYKPKKNIRRKMGHRQPFTRVKITSITK